ncbi:MAG: hemerythrin domain-containing protein [Myxococcales bacterium]|nr:hemerythrin domain-containing protein [Myxococcales bacterium]
MDIVTVLKADHRNVEQFFSQIESSSDRALKTKERLFLEIKKELTIHMMAEEKILYPRMLDIPELRKAAFEANEEHRLVKQLLDETSELVCGSEQWNAKLKVIKDLVRHHVQEEEGEIFKKLRHSLSSAVLNEMGSAVAEIKSKSRPTPTNGDARTAV